MKGKKLLSVLLYGAIVCCIAVSGAGCIMTAFSFHKEIAISDFGTFVPADMLTVVLWSVVFSLLCAFVFSKKRSWVAFLAVSAAVVGFLAVTGMLKEFYELAYQISVFYDKAYHWGTLPKVISTVEIVGPSAVYVVEMPKVTGGLVGVCAFIATVVNWALWSKKPTAVAVAASAFPLIICCVVTDTVPDEKYLFPLLFGLLLLILTGSARRRSEKAGMQLMALLMVPVMLASMFLSYKLPRESYERQSETALQTMLSWVKGLPFVVQLPDGRLEISVTGKAPENVDLTAVGPMIRVNYPVMNVVSPVTQRLYLRGQSFDTYDGKSWTNSDKSTGMDIGWPQWGEELGTVTVRTFSRPGYRFVPYYTAGYKDFVKGAVEDTDGIREYSYTVIEPAMATNGLGVMPSASTACLALNEKTREETERIAYSAIFAAAGKYTDLTVRERKAKIIEEYVRNCAAYSLDTPRMPEDAEDFALWFLQNAETGYCTHFATAATMLLRAAGIPARYVTGYAVEVTAGQRVMVTSDKSHAWVEYLNDDNIWTVLEATPGEWIGETSTQPETQPTEPPVTDPTAPTIPDNTDPLPTDETETRPSRPIETTGQQDQHQEQEVDRSGLWAALRWLGGILGVLAAVAGQYFLRRQLRRKKMQKGSPNDQALRRWAFVKRMAKLVGQKPPEELYRLAEKAKFSQHTLTEEELARMDGYLEQAQQAFCKKNWLPRLVIRLIWAV